jgi:glutamine amidotransferase
VTSSTSTSGADRQDRPLIAVLDYGIGNLRSAQKGLQFVGADAQLTSDKKLIADAQAVVLPGVGNFGACMTALRQAGLEESVHAAVASNRPFLGICVGIKWLPAGVQRPQMQWNQLRIKKQDDLFAGLSENPWMYFVHSLSAVATDASVVAANCEYGTELVAAVRLKNIFATQFHPEKSATEGLKILENFVDTCSAVATSK